MTTKKKVNWKNILSFALYLLTFVIVASLVIAIPIRLANYFRVTLFTGLLNFLILVAVGLASLISGKLFGRKFRPLFTNFRDGVVISLSWLLFFLLGFSAFDIKDSPPYLCMLTFPIALFVAVSFAYLFGTDELKQKMRNYPKMFRKRRPRKP